MEKELDEYEFWQDIEKDNKQSLFALNKENIELKSRIDKAIEYIKEKYDYILGDDTFLDHDEIIDRKQIIHILAILGGKNDKN